MDDIRYRKILLPVDGSEASRRAVAHGLALARASGAEVLLVHVRARVSELLGEPYYQRVLDHACTEAEKLVGSYRPVLEEAGVSFETRVLEGDPAQAVCTAARVEGADLIAMGTRGVSDFEGLLLGSVSHKVLQKAPCPVLVVR